MIFCLCGAGTVRMFLKDFIRHQKPFTVSLVSFLLMLAIVTVIGLVGSNHIIRYLQVQLMAHGLNHNAEVIESISPLLERGLQDGKQREAVVSDFQSFIEHAEPFGVRLFLIDRQRDLVVADSETRRGLPFPVKALLGTPARRLDGEPISDLGRWQGAAWRVTPSGSVELISLKNIDGGDAHWGLGVTSDVSELLDFMDELHLHLDTVLLITYALIGVLGFGVLRWVGRRYESSLEAQVIQRTDELEAVHRKLLEQARLATIGQTASVLAHEMRNPLASMKLALSGVNRSGKLPERERQRLELVLGEVDRLEQLLSETLEYVKPVVRDDQPVSLDELLDQVLELEQPLMERQGVLLHRQRCQQCLALRLDSHKVQQALLNLVRNAREASPRGGTIDIVLDSKEEELVLEIANQGNFPSSEVRSRAFDFFFTTKARGTGLGLGLVKRVVEEHGGTISLEEQKETGRVVARVQLPAREPEQPPDVPIENGGETL